MGTKMAAGFRGSVRRRRRARGFGRGVAVVALAFAVFPAGAVATAASAGSPVGVAHSAAARLTAHNDGTASLDNLRTGWDRNEPGLSPSAVASSRFGQVFSTAVNGQVYAQPLVIGSTVIVATEKDWVYGLNAATGTIEWSRSLGTSWGGNTCPDLAPRVGITSTPVYDPYTKSVYVMALIRGKAVSWHMFGLNVQTGAITLDRRIYGRPVNDPNITFTAKPQGQRTGLLLLHGWVYAGFASYCDFQPYAGYVAGVNVAGRKKSTLWTDEAGVANDQAGIWQSGGGLVSDGPGRIILTSGNGISPPAGPGTTPSGQLAESTIRLAQQPDGTLAAQDFFSPANAPTLDAGDLDFGSAGPVGLPVGTTAYPHILVQAGKTGIIFLLNRDSLGGRAQGPGATDDALFQSQAYGGLWGHPAVFEASKSALPPSSSGLSDYVYSVGDSDYLRAFQIGTDSTGLPALTDAANSTFAFGYTSGSPVVTSDGNAPSSAVVWVVDSSGDTGTSSSLMAFDAAPQPASGGGLQLKELASEPIGTASKFCIPATSNGMIYVGTRDGDVLGFGVTGAAALRRGPTASFGRTAVGSAATRMVTATAARTVTVTGISASAATSPDPFTPGKVTETFPGRPGPRPVTFPVTLHPGDRLNVPVRFSPAAPGGTTGTVSFTTAGRHVPAIVPLIADATRAGLYATVTHLSMLLTLQNATQKGPVPVGLPVYAVTTIVNGGTTAQRITRVSAPAAPFAARFLPRPGEILRPGQSVTVQVGYTPRRAVSSTGTLTIAGASGTPARITLSGSGQPAHSKFTASSKISFGTVRVGRTATRFIHIINAGNEGATATVTGLAGPFRAPYKVAYGLPINSGYDLSIPVTFSPSTAGHVTGRYHFSWSDRSGTHTLTVPITATGVT